MEDKKMLNNEELEKVVGGWTHNTETIVIAFSNAHLKIGNQEGRVRFSGEFSSGASETVEILVKMGEICDQAGKQALTIDSAIDQLRVLLWSIPISEIKFACDDILEELTEAVI